MKKCTGLAGGLETHEFALGDQVPGGDIQSPRRRRPPFHQIVSDELQVGAQTLCNNVLGRGLSGERQACTAQQGNSQGEAGQLVVSHANGITLALIPEFLL